MATADDNAGRKGRTLYKLSAVALKKKMLPGKYNDGGNLYLVVHESPGQQRSWVFQYRLNGRAHDMGLGSLRTVSLKEARETARRYRQLLRDGIDPLTTRRLEVATAKATRTFRQCAEGYWAAFAAGWSLGYVKTQRVNFERWVFPIFGDLPVQAVDMNLVTKALEPVWSKPVTAKMLRAQVEAVFGWATARFAPGRQSRAMEKPSAIRIAETRAQLGASCGPPIRRDRRFHRRAAAAAGDRRRTRDRIHDLDGGQNKRGVRSSVG